jgi:hypothetical protein
MYTMQQFKYMGLKMQKPLLAVVAFYAQVQISLHSSPKMQVNCPILHDVSPTPVLLSLNPPLDYYLLIPHTYCTYVIQFKQAKDDIGTSELFLSSTSIILLYR